MQNTKHIQLQLIRWLIKLGVQSSPPWSQNTQQSYQVQVCSIKPVFLSSQQSNQANSPVNSVILSRQQSSPASSPVQPRSPVKPAVQTSQKSIVNCPFKGNVQHEIFEVGFFPKHPLLVLYDVPQSHFYFWQFFRELLGFSNDSLASGTPGSRTSPVNGMPGSQESPVSGTLGSCRSPVSGILQSHQSWCPGHHGVVFGLFTVFSTFKPLLQPIKHLSIKKQCEFIIYYTKEFGL